ncbi:MAG: hypothetical protein LUD81_05780, partial [Clostridiales bacterium]|nr:hypothetical protein [Clostridiales bacterium]
VDLKTAGYERELEKNAALLNSLSPFRVLERGYSIVKKDGNFVDSAEALAAGDRIEIGFKDGSKTAVIEETENGQKNI